MAENSHIDNDSNNDCFLTDDDNLVPLLVDEDDDPNDTYINASFITVCFIDYTD